MKLPWIAEIIKHPGGHLYPKLRHKDREQFKTWVASQFKEGDTVWLTISKPSKDRTHEQFRYLYSCVYPFLAEEIGCTVDEIDGICKFKLLRMNPDSPLEYVKNKTDLDRAELAEYIDGVRRWAAAMGIETMDPSGGKDG